MKKIHFLVSLIVSIMLTQSPIVSAQTIERDAGTWADLKQAWIDSQQSGILSADISLTGNITINEDYDLTAINPVTIDCKTFNITIQSTQTVARTVTFGGELTVLGTAANLINTGGSSLTTITFNGGNYSLSGNNYVIRANSNSDITINEGSFSVSTGNSLINLNHASATMTVNGGTFSAEYVAENSRGFVLGQAGCKLYFNDGTLRVGSRGRAFFINGGGDIYISGGTITMTGSNNQSQIFRLQDKGNKYIEINAGTFVAGGGDFVVFNGNDVPGTVVVRDMSISGVRNLYTKGSLPTVEQLIYDFRGFTIIPSVPPGPISELTLVALSLPEVIIPNPVDAAGAQIYYHWVMLTMSSKAVTDEAYTEPILVSAGMHLFVYVSKDGYSSSVTELFYGDPNGIEQSSISRTKAYIIENTLYLPESSTVQVYNVNGQLVLNAVGATLDVSSLSKGIYVVRSGATTFKVVK